MQAGDRIITQKQEELEIIETKFNYEPKRVYNFEVADWHTYFVGALAWLIHNAKEKCVTELLEKLKRTKHVDNRHVSRKKYPTKSKYKKPNQIRKLEERTIKKPDRVTPQGKDRVLYEKKFDRVIGTRGEKIQRIVIDTKKKKRITSFPSDTFK